MLCVGVTSGVKIRLVLILDGREEVEETGL